MIHLVDWFIKEQNIKRDSKIWCAKIALFGSILTDKFDEKSDIDILIEFEGRKSLFDLVRLEAELENILQRKVDIITYNSLHPLLKDQILQEQVVITWLRIHKFLLSIFGNQ